MMKLRRSSCGYFLIVLAWSGVTATSGQDQAETVKALEHPAVTMEDDGSLMIPGALFRGSAVPREEGRAVRVDFGLPERDATKRWQEKPNLPIHGSTWEHKGIRYTQTAYIHPGRTGADSSLSTSLGGPVVMVQLTGENFSTDYTNATTALSLTISGEPLELELRDAVVYALINQQREIVAVLEVAPEGVDRPDNRSRLRFRGHMPPGTSGAMTVKIPLYQPATTSEVDRLRDLEFDDELRRLKRRWKQGTPKPLSESAVQEVIPIISAGVQPEHPSVHSTSK